MRYFLSLARVLLLPTRGVCETRGPTNSRIRANLTVDISTNVQFSQDYFQQTISNVKKVLLTYGSNGRSRGVATIIFRTGDAGQKAVKQLDGVKVDGRPMRVSVRRRHLTSHVAKISQVELIVGASQVSAPAAPKGLADRMS